MNRDIEFRGKCDYGNNNWAFGSLLLRSNGTAEIAVHDDRKCCCLDFRTVIPETVGQYTGLKDKNGVKIFEGDIVCRGWTESSGHKHREKYLVTFEDGCFTLRRPDKCYKSGLHPTGISLFFENKHFEELKKAYPDVEMYFEVIGNIHDNKELLGE
jgi:uncharacterized phage protein (TIGR01671 family)